MYSWSFCWGNDSMCVGAMASQYLGRDAGLTLTGWELLLVYGRKSIRKVSVWSEMVLMAICVIMNFDAHYSPHMKLPLQLI